MRRIAAGTALMVVLASSAHAQEPAGTFDELRMLVKPGDTLTVTDSSGLPVRGKLAEVTTSWLVLSVSGTQRPFDSAHVSTITKRGADSLKNGALIGMCITGGILAGGLAAAGVKREELGQALVAALVYTSAGAAIGAGIDALVPGQRVIYASATGTKLTIAPLLAAHRQGVLMSVRLR